jgi:hypothetical protein
LFLSKQFQPGFGTMFSFLVKFCILVTKKGGILVIKGFFGRKKGAHYGHIMKIISFNLSHLDSKF